MRGQASFRQTASSYQAKLQTTPSHEIRLISSPDLTLSGSDVSELDLAIEKYGHMRPLNFERSFTMSPARKTPQNELIPFELMFEGREDAALTLELLEDTAAEETGVAMSM